MEVGEGLEVGGIVGGGAPFALDGDGGRATGSPNEVDFVFLFVSPIVDFLDGEVGVEGVEDEVFPKGAHVVGA